MDSILSKDKECWFCLKKNGLHRHHVFYGTANRKQSDECCWVWLCAEHHNMSRLSVHMDHSMDLFLKRACQEKYEELYGRQQFVEKFGRSWL